MSMEFKKLGQYTSSDEGPHVGTALTFLFIGLGIGALSALLFAPKSGKQVRRDLRRKYEDAREVVEDWAEQASDIADDVLDRSKEYVDRGKDVLDRGRDLANKAKDRVAPMTKGFGRG